MKNTVSVSIIAANYNNGQFLHDFIQSIINSTVLPEELIIIDDGSTDNSLSILDDYQYLDFLKPIRFQQHIGLTAALNAGLDVAKGKYIMRADPDDILLPNRIERQFKFMEENEDVDIAGANVIYFNDKDKKEINVSNFPLTHKGIVKAYQRGEHGLHHPTIIAKSAVYQLYRYQKVFPGEDYEIFSRMVSDGKRCANLKEPVNLMRIHGSSSTSNLKFEAIRQTFEFRDKIFRTKTSKWWIYVYYQHILHYRSYQITKKLIPKYFHLFISCMMYPSKAWRKLVKCTNNANHGLKSIKD